MKISKTTICALSLCALFLAAATCSTTMHDVFTKILGSVFTMSNIQVGKLLKVPECFFVITAFTGFCILALSSFTEQKDVDYISL